ncbi:FAS-associated factor 1 [Nymphon striatum]|nr:FAS-associated factor 1 [Nymphon striatum]
MSVNLNACTSIDDVARCITILEECDWDLTQALNKVMSSDSDVLTNGPPMEIIENSFHAESHVDPPTVPSLPMSSRTALMNTTPEIIEASRQSVILYGGATDMTFNDEDIVPAPDLNYDFAKPGPSFKPTRQLHFSIEYNNSIIPIIIDDKETIGALKGYIQKETGIDPSNQDLRGWKCRRRIFDNLNLSSLNLPKENVLSLMSPDPPVPNGEDVEIEDAFNDEFKFLIQDETNNKALTVRFCGTKTVAEFKRDIYSITDIPVRHQIWGGWPLNIEDESTLASCGLDVPTHNLTLKSQNKKTNSIEDKRNMVIDLSSSDSGEEFEDANESFNIEDDIFTHESPKKSQPLIPENVEDDVFAIQNFTVEFVNRYGHCHPMFFQGTLKDAMTEAFDRPARERKQLLIYLHHDSSVLSNVFCTQLLCSETIVSYLTSNFIVWGWDLTFKSNKTKLLSMVLQHFGSVASHTIQQLKTEQLPLLLVINRCRSSNEFFIHINMLHLIYLSGDVSLDELMTSLIHAVDVFSEQQNIEGKEEDERKARELVKQEQDSAYQASLLADMAKEQARKAEEEEHKQIELHKQEQQHKLEEATRHEEAIKEAIRQSLEQQLPNEPPPDSSDPVSIIRLRCPSGDTIKRRFLACNKLQILLNFVASKGYPIQDFKVLSSWPRKDLSTCDKQLTLEALKLYPQETLILEER